jgi:hypothetical protein
VKSIKITLLITSILITGLLLNVAYAFTDVSTQNKFLQAINTLTDNGIVSGYPDETFRPDNKITRAEFLKIIIASTTSNPAGKNCFNDVHTEWFAKYICYAKTHDIVSGYSDGNFKPTANINLAEALKISIGKLPASPREYWYSPYQKIATENNYYKNIDKNAGHEITRGEAAQLIYNIQQNPSTSSPITGLFDNEYPDLPPGKWDWNDADNDGANYRNFETNIGTFEALKDSSGNQYGWQLIGNNPNSIDYSGAAAYFEGSPGTDILKLGENGSIGSFGSGNLGDGPDVLVFENSHSLDFRQRPRDSRLPGKFRFKF